MVSHVALISTLLVRQMTQFHGLHDAIHDQRRSEAGSQPQKQHPSTLVAAEALHGCIIDKLYRTAESGFEAKTNPSPAEVAWFRHRSISQHRTWEANRNGVVLPISSNLLHARDHFLSRQRRARFKFS